VLIVMAGVALVMLAKNGLGDVQGLATLGCFTVAAAAARICAGSKKQSPQRI
jgi:hypothetical protein